MAPGSALLPVRAPPPRGGDAGACAAYRSALPTGETHKLQEGPAASLRVQGVWCAPRARAAQALEGGNAPWRQPA